MSVAIYSTDQNPLEGVQGIQMQATATIVPDDEMEKAFEIDYFNSELFRHERQRVELLS